MDIFFKNGTDEEFTHQLGKDCYYNAAGDTPSDSDPVYRIISRIVVLVDDERKYFVLKAVDPNNTVQQFELPLEDKNKLKVIDCVAAIDSVWKNVAFDGNMNKTINYLRNEVFSRCDIHDRNVKFSIDGDTFKMDFDGEKTYECKCVN